MTLDPYQYYLVHLEKIRDEWKKFPDFKSKHKSFGKNKVYLFYGTERGGTIILRLRSGKEEYHLDEEVNFMDWENALAEYNQIKSTKDMMDLLRRNQ